MAKEHTTQELLAEIHATLVAQHNTLGNLAFRVGSIEQRLDVGEAREAILLKMSERIGGLLQMYIDQNDPAAEEGVEQLTTPAKR